MHLEFAPPRWAVPGVIADGVSILAGPPKVGKSWLALGVAVSIATGGWAFGRVSVDQGDVLYLALEDTGRRLQSRLRRVLVGDHGPERLTFSTRCPPFPEAAAHLRRWLDRNPGARLIVVDVLAKVRPRPDTRQPAYDADYAAMAAIKEIADAYGVPVLVVHHVRKQKSGADFLDDVSGTHGIAGAADAVLVLRRSRGDADGELLVVGRDIDETGYALTFDKQRGAWELCDGPSVEHLIGDTRATILRHLRAHPGHSPMQIAAAIDLDYELVKKTCKRMADDGQAANDGQGHYACVPDVPTVPVAGQGMFPGVPDGVPEVSPDEWEE